MKVKALFLSFLMLSVLSCRVTLVPAYDAAMEEEIIKAAKLNDAVYLEMLEIKESDRRYSDFSQRYLAIELEINSILMKTRARDHNKDLLVIVENLQTMFLQFKNDHKTKNALSDADIKLNQVQIRGMWTPLLIAEKALKRQK